MENTETATTQNLETKPEVTTEQFVPKAELERVLQDMHKYKQQVKAYSEQLENAKMEKLKETNNWQEIAKVKEEEAVKAKEEADRLKSSFISEKKFSHIKEAALKQGLRTDAIQDLELLSFDDVLVETTSTGKINILGIDRYIQNLKMSRPHWFGSTKTVVNGSIPSTTTHGTVTKQDLLKLSMEAQKSGDYTAYQNAMKTYQQGR